MRAFRLVSCKGFVEEFLGLFGSLPRLSGVEVTGLFVRVSVCHAQRDESGRAENCSRRISVGRTAARRGGSALPYRVLCGAQRQRHDETTPTIESAFIRMALREFCPIPHALLSLLRTSFRVLAGQGRVWETRRWPLRRCPGVRTAEAAVRNFFTTRQTTARRSSTVRRSCRTARLGIVTVHRMRRAWCAL